jgi:hypothetical protein
MAQAGRKVKLEHPETRRRFLQVLAQTGQDKAACMAAGINQTTLYRYLKRDPAFADARHRAQEEFWRRDDPELVAHCREALIRLLQGPEEEWTTIETTVLPSGEKVEKRSVKRVKRGPSMTGVEKVLPMLSGQAAGTDLSRVNLEISGPGGSPIQHENLSDEELSAELIRLLGGTAAGAQDASSPALGELPAGFGEAPALGAGSEGD